MFWFEILKEEVVILAGDLNGHLGEKSDGYEGVHDGFGFGQRNDEGTMVLETADAMQMLICNTMFMKEERKRVTYCSGEKRSMVDYVLMRQRNRGMLRNVSVIAGRGVCDTASFADCCA